MPERRVRRCSRHYSPTIKKAVVENKHGADFVADFLCCSAALLPAHQVSFFQKFKTFHTAPSSRTLFGRPSPASAIATAVERSTFFRSQSWFWRPRTRRQHMSYAVYVAGPKLWKSGVSVLTDDLVQLVPRRVFWLCGRRYLCFVPALLFVWTPFCRFRRCTTKKNIALPHIYDSDEAH